MKSRLTLPGLVLVLSLSSVAAAGTAEAASTQPHACFGAYASTFAQTSLVPSGELVSTVATSEPGAVGQFASNKVPCR